MPTDLAVLKEVVPVFLQRDRDGLLSQRAPLDEFLHAIERRENHERVVEELVNSELLQNHHHTLLVRKSGAQGLRQEGRSRPQRLCNQREEM